MKNLKKIIIHLLLCYFCFLILNNTAQANNIKNSAVVFMYHKFGKPQYPSTNIDIEIFDQHLEEFSKPKYSVLPLDFITDTIINDGSLPLNTIGISVDDADRSFLTTAWPKLKEKGFPVTLFVSTASIPNKGIKSNYLNWDEIRLLKSEGVNIGSHSHTHEHLADYSFDELINEIEISNKIFLKELGEIPNLFAYPYGEANKEMFELLNSYKFKVAFGQHSGVINETSNLYFLPRFSLNERYGKTDRVIFAANTKGLGVYDFVPPDPQIKENPPFIGFSLLDQKLSQKINCFIFDSNGKAESELFKFNERIEIRINRKLEKGRVRLNCTTKDDNGNWRWFGHQFIL